MAGAGSGQRRAEAKAVLRGIKRLAERLKKAFPHLSDHAAFGWDVRFRPGYGTVSKKQLGFYDRPIIWQEYEGLKKLLEEEDRFTQDWADRRQKFHWVNDIEYTYGPNNARNREIVHLVICEESWQEVDPETGETITSTFSPSTGTS